MHGLLNLIYRFYPLAIAALLAAGAVWLERTTRSPEPTANVTVSETPDFIAETVRITGFAADGKLHYTLDSPVITHLPVADTTHAEQPRLQLFSHERRMWINADRADVAPKGTQVDFIGNVEAEREGVLSDPPLHLSTEHLTVWPQEQRAVSNVPVRLTHGETRGSGNNLEADNVFGVITLSGKVRMLLTPRNKRKS
ncbi:MAG: LPS export ABC transporter periplasmic protein LptC [Azoarcus sp.]|jgi:lipopolysaccharide export system protein LptC|nr:LPS export ABC transporter periplasmic protein LptC [Azoarcus sp.]